MSVPQTVGKGKLPWQEHFQKVIGSFLCIEGMKMPENRCFGSVEKISCGQTNVKTNKTILFVQKWKNVIFTHRQKFLGNGHFGWKPKPQLDPNHKVPQLLHTPKTWQQSVSGHIEHGKNVDSVTKNHEKCGLTKMWTHFDCFTKT